MDKNPVEAKATGRAKRKLSLKQRRFAAAYADPNAANGNGRAAAAAAGYKGAANQLSVQAWANLQNPQIQQLISATVDAMIPHAFNRLGEAMDATKSKVLLNKAGKLVYSAPIADHKSRLEAIKFVFELRSKCGVGAPEPGDEAPDHAADQGENLDAADRALIRQASDIEAELAEIDNVGDGGGDYGTDR